MFPATHTFLKHGERLKQEKQELAFGREVTVCRITTNLCDSK